MAQTLDYAEPRPAKWLFTSSQAGILWLVLRVWVGYQWLHAGWEKVIGYSGGTFSWKFGMTDESWLRTTAGLKGFVGFALQGAGGEHAAVNYGWYASFLRWLGDSGSWLAPVIAIGEVMIGIGLIFGILTGISAFFGVVLNTSFGLAGVAGVNPLFTIVEIFLILAWRNAGYYGVDRYLLPALGTPWQPGTLFRKEKKVQVQGVTA
jgi:thiosulfate dehydrogenase [quinone] large subunit